MARRTTTAASRSAVLGPDGGALPCSLRAHSPPATPCRKLASSSRALRHGRTLRRPDPATPSAQPAELERAGAGSLLPRRRGRSRRRLALPLLRADVDATSDGKTAFGELRGPIPGLDSLGGSATGFIDGG